MFSVTVSGLHEHEVLVDHADAQVDGLAGALDVDGRAVDEDLAGVGGEQPVGDVHQRRLAGAVLAEQGDDLAAVNVERDVVVREDARESLGDVREPQNGRRRPRTRMRMSREQARGAPA